MDPVLSIIQYLFKKRKLKNVEGTLNSFFDNGVSFPRFVAFAFQIDQIPNFIQNPEISSQKNNNNELAYKFLVDKTPEISKISPDIRSIQNRYNILLFIITKKIYDIESNNILDKCNKIVQPLKIIFKSKKNLISVHSILALLNVLTDGKVQLETTSKNYEYIINQSLQKAKVPCILDKKSLEKHNHTLFLIQIKIILDEYSYKINETDKIPIQNKEDKKIINSESPKKKVTIIDDNYHQVKPNSVPKKGKTIDSILDLEVSIEESDELLDTLSDLNLSDIGSSRDNLLVSNDLVDSIQDNQSYSLDNFSDINDSNNNFLNSQDLKIKKKRKRKISSFENDNKFKSDELESKVLLNIINSICMDEKIHFNDFEQAMDEENFIKFLMIIFKNKPSIKSDLIQFIECYKNSEKSKIDIIIEYFSTIEQKFNVLVFDFQNSDFFISSAIQLYTKILNYFYLNTTKEKLFQRFYTILFYNEKPNLRDKDVEYKVLSNFSNYAKLIGFINSGSSKNKLSGPEKIALSLRSKHILVLNEEFLNECLTATYIPSTVYFQIQLIFNYLDENMKKSRVYECFYIKNKEIKLIKVPPISKLTNSIKTKYLSLILQMRRTKLYSKEKNTKNSKLKSDEINNKNDNISDLFSDGINNKSEKNSDLDLNDKSDNDLDLNIVSSFELKNFKPKIFLDRRGKYSGNLQNTREMSLNSISFENAETFWNKGDLNYVFRDGILFDKTIQKDLFTKFWKKWDKEYKTKEIKKERQFITLNFNKQTHKNEKQIKTLNFTKQFQMKESKTYILYHYDEEQQKWIYNEKALNELISDNKIDSTYKTPLVLFFNSNEFDSIAIYSNLVNNGIFYHIINNEETIFVYGICDKDLKEMNLTNEEIKNKPIFLFLHVPKSKQEMPNITNIIFEIYSFLFFIQNIVIFILNKKEQLQFGFYEDITRIKNSFQFYQENKLRKSLKQSIKKSKNGNFDEDEEEEEDLNEIDYNENEFYIQHQKISLLKKLNEEFFYKPLNIILLINDERIQTKTNINSKSKIDLFKKIKSDNLTLKCHFINQAETVTYKPFSISLYEFATDKNNYNLKEVEINFQFLPLFEMSNVYIQMKHDEKNFSENLKQIINDRFKMLKKNNNISPNDFTIISELQNELLSTFPLLDTDYYEKCNLALYELKVQTSKVNKDLLATELEISSRNKLEYLKYIIKKEPYWSKEQIVSIRDSHINFLKKEFFDIIHCLFDVKILIMIYTDNINILDDQIKKDLIEIDKMFDEFFMKLNSKKKQMKKLQQGANTNIREIENEREIKARVMNGGKLEDLIDQDF